MKATLLKNGSNIEFATLITRRKVDLPREDCRHKDTVGSNIGQDCVALLGKVARGLVPRACE